MTYPSGPRPGWRLGAGAALLCVLAACTGPRTASDTANAVTAALVNRDTASFHSLACTDAKVFDQVPPAVPEPISVDKLQSIGNNDVAVTLLAPRQHIDLMLDLRKQQTWCLFAIEQCPIATNPETSYAGLSATQTDICHLLQFGS
ncbi:MAG TPA: hypothetical protein VHZ97_25965 [Pseudonocardiaceae bacterium]|nr:hypothetical protein [Pseudonocardiaceae bacterium]